METRGCGRRAHDTRRPHGAAQLEEKQATDAERELGQTIMNLARMPRAARAHDPVSQFGLRRVPQKRFYAPGLALRESEGARQPLQSEAIIASVTSRVLQDGRSNRAAPSHRTDMRALLRSANAPGRVRLLAPPKPTHARTFRTCRGASAAPCR